jgi:hypothetical protein
MTDTPDVPASDLIQDLIYRYGRWLDNSKHNVDSLQRREFYAASKTLRARIEAGDAAIKCVAEVEKLLVEERITSRGSWSNQRDVDRSEADLIDAQAREIERLKANIEILAPAVSCERTGDPREALIDAYREAVLAQERDQEYPPSLQLLYLALRAKHNLIAALAPKGPNNG